MCNKLTGKNLKYYYTVKSYAKLHEKSVKRLPKSQSGIQKLNKFF